MIENTLLHFKTKAAFNTELEAGNIKDDSIVFIDESKEIWTHGTYYDCSEFDISNLVTKEETNNIIGLIPTKMSELDNDAYGVSSLGMEFALGDSPNVVSENSTWDNPNSTLSQRMHATLYGNGYFVVCGTAGEFVYSTDSVNWIKISPFTTDVITSIAYGLGIFLAVDSGGKIWIAYNTPMEWSQVDISFEYILENVVYANNRFLIVGGGGFVAVSNNGKDWKTSAIGTLDKYSVCYGNGKYVAVGLNGTIFYSFDGMTWTDVSDPNVTASLRTVYYGKGVFVCGGQGGLIRYSTDGLTWNTATNNTTATISYIRDIVYTEGRFYAVMYTSAGKGEIWVSNDAASWTVQYLANGRVWCVAVGDSKVFASGDNGIIYRLDLGIEWLDYEPEIVDGKYLWTRIYAILTDGSKIVGENVLNVNTKVYALKTDKASSATSADSATKATQDASGNVITSTYATKAEVTTGLNGKISANGTVTSVIAMSQSEYDALETKDPTTLYIIVEP